MERCIGLCLEKGIDFAVCLMPGETVPHIFIPSLPDQGKTRGTVFEIGPWLKPYAERITIDGETDLKTAFPFLEMIPTTPDSDNAPNEGIPVRSTTRESYLADVSKVIDSCRHRGGKTVFSRVICGETQPNSWPKVFSALCESFPETFRFIFHSRLTGGWIGATPETLLDVDTTNGCFRTMAFAGTRAIAAHHAHWDEKNIRENRYVSDYLTEKINSLGMEANVGEPTTVAYGSNIEHLCRHITGSLPSGTEFQPLLDAINPTPALCGSPLADAVGDLSLHERHERGCYGGFVALHDNRRFNSFVTLRCCAFNQSRFAIYAGGGITPDSIPENEWDETEAKSLFFRRYLQNNS